MSKKIVGLIVATVIIVVLLLAVLIGGLRLRKDGADSSNNQQRVAVSQSQPTQNQGQQQTQASNSPQSASAQVKNSNNQGSTVNSGTTGSNSQTDSVSNEQNNQELVDKVVKQSSQVDKSNTQPENQAVTMTPSKAELKPDVFELNGVVKDLYLVNDGNGVQSYYKVVIEVPLGNETLDLDYLTTSSSLNALSKGVSVIVDYQLTSDNTVVIKSLSLKK